MEVEEVIVRNAVGDEVGSDAGRGKTKPYLHWLTQRFAWDAATHVRDTYSRRACYTAQHVALCVHLSGGGWRLLACENGASQIMLLLNASNSTRI